MEWVVFRAPNSAKKAFGGIRTANEAASIGEFRHDQGNTKAKDTGSG